VEQVQRFCDFQVVTRKGSAAKPHGERIENDEITTFEYNGKRFEVDICKTHRETLEDALDPFIAIAKKTEKVTAPPARNGRGRLVHKRGKATFTTKDVRKWLEEQGRPVAPSGRIAKDLVSEYEAAHAR